MLPAPVPLSLIVCERVIVEEGTGNISLISCFTKLLVDSFPTDPQRLAVFSAFRSGLGAGTIDLVITQVETDEEIDTSRSAVEFPDRLREVCVIFTLEHCIFPGPGRYLFTITIDGEWAGQREIDVAAMEDET